MVTAGEQAAAALSIRPDSEFSSRISSSALNSSLFTDFFHEQVCRPKVTDPHWPPLLSCASGLISILQKDQESTHRCKCYADKQNSKYLHPAVQQSAFFFNYTPRRCTPFVHLFFILTPLLCSPSTSFSLSDPSAFISPPCPVLPKRQGETGQSVVCTEAPFRPLNHSQSQWAVKRAKSPSLTGSHFFTDASARCTSLFYLSA